MHGIEHAQDGKEAPMSCPNCGKPIDTFPVLCLPHARMECRVCVTKHAADLPKMDTLCTLS